LLPQSKAAQSRTGLFGQDHLTAEAPVLGTHGAEVDAAGTSATFRILPVPRQVVVSGPLVAVRRRRRQLAGDIVAN